MAPPALRSLDLFSGMGGITYALRNLQIHPVAYCEWAPGPRTLLERLIAAKALPAAPIEPDVRDIPDAKYKGKVDIIVGGFPCIGWSSAGKREGFDNAQSALFGHIVRLARSIRPKFIFLENVRPIATFDGGVGVKFVVKSLAPLGYELRWMIVKACDVGAPQVRARWFCLCVRSDVAAVRLAQTPVVPFDWSKTEPRHRMRPSLTEGQRQFDRACGNGVVPDAVRAAFILLFEGGVGDGQPKVDLAKLFSKRHITLAPIESVPHTGDHYAKMCVFRPKKMKTKKKLANGIEDAIVQPVWPARTSAAVDLTMNGKLFKPKRGIKPQNELPLLTTPHKASMWPTPRAGNAIHAANFPTARTTRDIGTMLRFEKSTKDGERGGLVAPEFLGWLMGFPAAWIKTASGVP